MERIALVILVERINVILKLDRADVQIAHH